MTYNKPVMYPKILEAQSPGIASTMYGTEQVHYGIYVLPCVYVTCTPMAMSVLGLNFKVPAASFTSKFLKNI